MRRLLLLIIGLNLVSLLIVNMAMAGNGEGNPTLCLSLDEVIKRAVDTNEEFKIKEKEVNKTEGIYREARSNMLPHITAQSTWAYNIDSPTLIYTIPNTAMSLGLNLDDYYQLSGVNASQVIWSFGKVMYAVSSAKRLVEASRFNREAGKQEVIFTAKLSYYSTLLARNALSITEKSYANALENKKLLGQRSYGGRSPKYEIIRMDAEVAARVPTVNEARTQFDVAAETLKKLIDANPVSKIELIEDFSQNYPDLDYEMIAAKMYEDEPSLKALDKTVESAEAKVKSSIPSFFPTLSAFSALDYFGGSKEHAFLRSKELDRYAFAGLKLDIPIWEGCLKEAQLSQARADKEISILKKKQVEKGLLLELKKAYLEYQQYKDNLKANIEAVRLAEEAFKQTQEMFASGQATLTDLNTAELLLTNQRLNKEMTLFNINITLARIERLIAGQYDEQNIDKKS
jgi:outer membrane protein TolC